MNSYNLIVTVLAFEYVQRRLVDFTFWLRLSLIQFAQWNIKLNALWLDLDQSSN